MIQIPAPDNNKKSISIWFFICLVLLFLLIKFYNEAGKLSDAEQLYEASLGELQVFKNKEGLYVAEKKLLVGSIDDLKKIHAKDSSDLYRLKILVNKNTLSATIFVSATSNTEVSKTKISFDTINKKGDTVCNPIYSTAYKNKWENIDITASKDSIHLNYTVFNDYEIVQEIRKQGPWYNKNEVPYISIKNNNPHTTTTALQSFAVQPPPSKKGWWLATGTIAGFILGTFIVK